MGAGAGKAFPTPGAVGSGLGPSASLQAMTPMQPMAGIKPLSANSGMALRPGQASPPVGQSPMNPWGKGSGGSGSLPLYRRPQTMPGSDY